MSYELLDRLQSEHAFDPAPRRVDLGVYHVPFERLGASRNLEQALLGAAQRAERVAVVGRSGCGKSSLLAHALGPLAEDVAPVLVRVAPEPAEVVTSVQSMAAHITQTLVDQAELVLADDDRRQALEATSPVREVPPESGGRQVTLGAGWMGVHLAGQIQRQQGSSVEHRRTAAATLEVLDQMLRLISDEGRLTPVLIFDDTDRWLRLVGETQTANELAHHFFARVLPELRELGCGLVVAVHENYLEEPEVARGIESSLEAHLDIPTLPGPAALGEVVHSRVRVHAETDVPLEDVIAAEAVDTLYELYRDQFRRELRTAIRTLHIALTDACDDLLNEIPAQLIRTAAVG